MNKTSTTPDGVRTRRDDLDETTPNARWANWALLDAVSKLENFKTDEAQSLLSLIVGRFRATLSEHEGMGPRSFVVATDDGHWGAGQTLPMAARKALAAGGRRPSKAMAWLILNDATPEVNQMGGVISDSVSSQFGLGVVGTLGSILNANPVK